MIIAINKTIFNSVSIKIYKNQLRKIAYLIRIKIIENIKNVTKVIFTY